MTVRTSAVVDRTRKPLRHAEVKVAGKKTELSADYIVPSVFNRAVAPAVAAAVAHAAEETGVARRRHAPADA